MWIEKAYAQAAGGGAAVAPDMFGMLVPFLLIFVVFYFLLIRPQQKQLKEHRSKIEAIRRGDQILTGGGIIGTVTKVTNDEELQVEIADGLRVRVRRATIADVLTKPQPVVDGDKGKNDDNAKEAKK